MYVFLHVTQYYTHTYTSQVRVVQVVCICQFVTEKGLKDFVAWFKDWFRFKKLKSLALLSLKCLYTLMVS